VTQAKVQLQAELDQKKKLQVEFNKHLVDCREEVDTWLSQLMYSIHREKAYLQDRGDIADGELKAPWDLLQAAIKKLRDCQHKSAEIKREVEEMLSDLADDEIWKGES
jgi:hypothetical protein